MSCQCCKGIQILSPETTANRPGLDSLAYRIGTHSTFLKTMKARLSSLYLEFTRNDAGGTKDKLYPLKNLRTREQNDPSLALLDAWAIVADVLTFYMERIANEGFLGTVTERRSIVELARLVGYSLRPGVAAGVYLAYSLDTGYTTRIPAGSRAQSIPDPGEQLQSFETSEALEAKAEWNTLKVRLTRPQSITLDNANTVETLYFKGTKTNLNPNDPVLMAFGSAKGQQFLRRVKAIEIQEEQNRTKVTLQTETPGFQIKPEVLVLERDLQVGDQNPILDFQIASKIALPNISILSKHASVPPPNALRLSRTVAGLFSAKADPKLLITLQPALSYSFYVAWRGMSEAPQPLKTYALRQTASLFGCNAPRKPLTFDRETGKILETGDWPVIESGGKKGDRVIHEEVDAVHLDSSYEKILPNSWMVVSTAKTGLTHEQTIIAKARNSVASVSRAEYGMTGKTTRIVIGDPADSGKTINWIELDSVSRDDFDAIRKTVVYAQSEKLELALEPIDPVDEPVQGNRIELEDLYGGLQSGRWLIITGERTDIPNVVGVTGAELLMLAGVDQDSDPSLPGDRVHSTLLLAGSLAYKYKRDTVTLFGNVVKATHGETHTEVLGSGDGSKNLQSFSVRLSPLTFLPANNPSGIESTLQVRVNDILWHAAETLIGLDPNDRRYIMRVDEGKGILIFGNGRQGVRLPTGAENIKSVYRTGLGKPGNVRAKQISLLATKPLGVKEVTNPLRASGGADAEGLESARRNVPLRTAALDRLVSVEDYAAFARTFAGIAKADATKLSEGRRTIVHVTIAGLDDIPLDPDSELVRSLWQALRQFGEPNLPVRLAIRDLMLLVISANVRLKPDYQWESVEPKIRLALLKAFNFGRRELAQSAFSSEVISVIQRIEGVAYIDLDVFDKVGENTTAEDLADLGKTLRLNDFIQAQPARITQDPEVIDPEKRILASQIAYLTAAVPDTLILKEITA